MAGRLVAATQALWARVALKMLPTPAKFHYLFNMRDISKARTIVASAQLVSSSFNPCKTVLGPWLWVFL